MIINVGENYTLQLGLGFWGRGGFGDEEEEEEEGKKNGPGRTLIRPDQGLCLFVHKFSLSALKALFRPICRASICEMGRSPTSC